MAEIDEIKKLSPEQRIRRLRKLEEEKRKEIEEAEKLMKESVGELEREEKIKKEMPIPQMRAVDVGELFTQEEKQMFAAKRYAKLKKEPEEELPKPEKEKTLEEEVWKEQPQLTPEQIEQQREYGRVLAAEKPGRLYEIAREVYDEFKETGMVDQEKLYAIDFGLRIKDDTSPGGEYKAPTQRAEEQMGSAKSIIKYLRGAA